MVVQRHIASHCQNAVVGQNAGANLGVRAHHVVLFLRQFAGLAQNRIRNAHFAHVMQAAGLAIHRGFLRGESELGRNQTRVVVDAVDMGSGRAVLELGNFGQHVQHVVIGLGQVNVQTQILQCAGALLRHHANQAAVGLIQILGRLDVDKPDRHPLHQQRHHIGVLAQTVRHPSGQNRLAALAANALKAIIDCQTAGRRLEHCLLVVKRGNDTINRGNKARTRQVAQADDLRQNTLKKLIQRPVGDAVNIGCGLQNVLQADPVQVNGAQVAV